MGIPFTSIALGPISRTQALEAFWVDQGSHEAEGIWIMQQVHKGAHVTQHTPSALIKVLCFFMLR
jgi:hypothetical protein